MDVDTPSSSKRNRLSSKPLIKSNGEVEATIKPSQRVCHMVAQLMHSKLVDYRSAAFRRHPDGTSYSIVNSGLWSDKVIQLGREESSAEHGSDYAIALVSKRSGKAQFFPAKLINFQATYSTDPDSVLGNRCSKQTDYTADHAGNRESWADKRRALTSEFGSAKKLKIQDAAKRRRVDDETLSIMMGSTFSSPSVNNKEEKGSALSISLLTKAESCVLPKANPDAKLPNEVYSNTVFLSEEEMTAMHDEAVEYLTRPKTELVGEDCSALVYRLVSDTTQDPQRCALALYFLAMVRVFKMLSLKRSKASIQQEEWSALNFPQAVTIKLRQTFLPGEFVKETTRSRFARLNVNLTEKDKLLAHTICLAILLHKETLALPITPWAKELNVSETKITKMLTALGCSVQAASVAEGLRLGTLRIGRLVGPPSKTTGYRKYDKRR